MRTPWIAAGKNGRDPAPLMRTHFGGMAGSPPRGSSTPVDGPVTQRPPAATQGASRAPVRIEFYAKRKECHATTVATPTQQRNGKFAGRPAPAPTRTPPVSNISSLPERMRRHVQHGEAMRLRHFEDGHQCPRERSEEDEWRQDLARFAAANVTGHRLGQASQRATSPERLGELVSIHQYHVDQLPLDAA